MHRLSRHLPPLQAEDGKIPLLEKAILVAIAAGIAYWIYSNPFAAAITVVLIFVFVGGSMLLETRRAVKFRQKRDDTICDFRRSFDIRKIDPWIIRATHEAFGTWFDAKQPQFPLRASDLIEDDLKIDWEDVDDLAHEVAQRAGYDISDCETNPLYGKIKTVEDFVLFFTYQPKTRAEQNGVDQAATHLQL